MYFDIVINIYVLIFAYSTRTQAHILICTHINFHLYTLKQYNTRHKA